jgi:maltose-binding protein MalE
MKKIALFATASIFSIAVMAQTESKLPTATKSSKSLSTKPKTETVPLKTETVPVKPESVQGIQPAQTTQTQPSPDDVIKVNAVKHDFGKIPQGKPVTYSFTIKNTSDKPIVVENTYASCGCTTPDKIVEPIAPGATVPLKVQYSAAGVGPFTKDVHIKLAGITQEKVVQITGEVLAPEPVKPNN